MHGLTHQEDEQAIQALILLSQDDDRDVRNWATFGLGTQIKVDTPAIRACLKERLTDPDHEIRGEALVGLALRHAPCVVTALNAEWQQHEDISVLSLEAAREVGVPYLLPQLLEFKEILDTSDDPYFARILEEAITACSRKGEQDA